MEEKKAEEEARGLAGPCANGRTICGTTKQPLCSACKRVERIVIALAARDAELARVEEDLAAIPHLAECPSLRPLHRKHWQRERCTCLALAIQERDKAQALAQHLSELEAGAEDVKVHEELALARLEGAQRTEWLKRIDQQVGDAWAILQHGKAVESVGIKITDMGTAQGHLETITGILRCLTPAPGPNVLGAVRALALFADCNASRTGSPVTRAALETLRTAGLLP